ncbi:hypothetical protein ACFLST_01385 [Chloroflexota bacterium]
MQEDAVIIYIRPGRCNTCKHHVIAGDYPEEDDYCEHGCHIEENEKEGRFPGMHLDHCVFPAASADEVCPCYEMMDVAPL